MSRSKKQLDSIAKADFRKVEGHDRKVISDIMKLKNDVFKKYPRQINKAKEVYDSEVGEKYFVLDDTDLHKIEIFLEPGYANDLKAITFINYHANTQKQKSNRIYAIFDKDGGICEIRFTIKDGELEYMHGIRNLPALIKKEKSFAGESTTIEYLKNDKYVIGLGSAILCDNYNRLFYYKERSAKCGMKGIIEIYATISKYPEGNDGKWFRIEPNFMSDKWKRIFIDEHRRQTGKVINLPIIKNLDQKYLRDYLGSRKMSM